MSIKCVFFLLFATAYQQTHGQIPSLGFCPDYLPMVNFEMERFLGKWYEAERYFTFTDVVNRCVVTDYAKTPSGRISVSNEVTNRLTGVKRTINGYLQILDNNNEEGKLNVKYVNMPIPSESNLVVLETDYDNYAVVWSCSNLGPVHAENAWLMTRERVPSASTLTAAYDVINKFKISRMFFVKSDQEGCAVAASELNAAKGITSSSTVPESNGTSLKNSKTNDADKSDVDDDKPQSDDTENEERRAKFFA